MRRILLKIEKKINNKYKEWKWKARVKKNLQKEKRQLVTNQTVVFDTSLYSKNKGDFIINFYCKEILNEVLGNEKRIYIPTHVKPTDEEIKTMLGSKRKIVCGTNLITPHYEEFTNWKMHENLYGYNDIITLGVGWGYYCKEISKISQYVYNNILSKTGIHSVRDEYTAKKFRDMGIKNVINTGCPTLWKLSEEHCKRIPEKKAKNVITTITDYDKDIENDKYLLETLLDEYDKVSIWIQGSEDLEYLKTIIDTKKIEIIDGDLEAYTRKLESGNIDYVGTRLHAGIHALNCKVRSLIIAIDNRAIEMGKDVNLPIIKRSELKEKLSMQINCLRKTEINIPTDAIRVWKQQFN